MTLITDTGNILPKAAVITRTRQRPLMLQRCLLSVCGQTMRDFTWVIVNDGGPPQPVDAIAGQARSRGCEVMVIHRAVSSGMEAASNAAIAASRSQFIAIHDDDDSWEPQFLARTVAFLEADASFGGVVTHARRLTEKIDGDRIRTLTRGPHHPILRSVQLADMLRSNLFPPIAFLYRREICDKLGGYNEAMQILGDWDFNLRFLLEADMGVLPEALANYHVRTAKPAAGDSYSNSITPREDAQQVADARYRNLMIRKDIQAGKAGLGTLLMLGRLGKDITAPRPARQRALEWLRKTFAPS